MSRLVFSAFILAVSGCSGNPSTGGTTTLGGTSNTGGTSEASATGGSSNAAGATQFGGTSNTGGTSEASATGGSSNASGGATATGGTSPTGGANTGIATGGIANTGGLSQSGGASSTGGSRTSTGGSPSTGGGQATGGRSSTGGSRTSTGGSPSTGGGQATGGRSSTGGIGATGGVTSTGGSLATGGTSSIAGTGGTQATGGSGQSSGCTDSATLSGSLTVRYGTVEIPTTTGGKSYFLSTNWWHKYTSQAVNYNGLSFAVSDPANTSVPASDGSPTGFPTLFIGSYSGHQTKLSNLPKQVSALTTVPTVFSTDASSHDTSNFNATYDVWFTASSATLPATASSPGAGGAYLMVWLYKPSQRQPRGTSKYPAHSVAGMSGTWDVWIDSSTNPPCISYVSTTALDSLSFDLNKFIQDSVTNSYGVTSSMYLSIVFAGFEIWSGGDGLTVEQFCAQVN